MTLIKTLFSLFDRRERLQIFGLAALLLVGSFFDVIGIGLVLPFMKVASDPSILLQNRFTGPSLRGLGLTDSKSIVIATGLVLLGLFLLKNAFLAYEWRIMYGFVYGKVVDLSRRLLAAYLQCPYTFHLQRNTADLISTTTEEANNVVSGILKRVITISTEATTTLGLLCLLFAAKPYVLLSGLAIIGSLGWVFSTVSKRKLGRLGRTRVEHYGRMIQWVNQSLGGIKEVKVLGREAYFVEAFRASSLPYAEALRDSSLTERYPRLMVETAAILGLVGLVTAFLVSGGDLQTALPLLALFGVAMVRLVPSVTSIVGGINGIRFYAPSVAIGDRALAEAAAAFRAARQIGAASQITFSDRIEINELTYSYRDGSNAAVDRVTLAIPRGTTVAFVGTSGAGKTTLVNLLLGLLEPTHGQILVDGISISCNLPGWQRQLGYIPQDIYLSDDALRRNVAFGVPDQEIDDAAIWQALESAQLASFVRALPDQLETMVGERGVRISAGQRQRIGIARALYHDPDLLVLDEATSALDTETERQVVSSVTSLSKTKTIIMVAHRLTTVRSASVIYVLSGGRIAGSGPYEELLESNPTFQQLVYAAEARAEE